MKDPGLFLSVHTEKKFRSGNESMPVEVRLFTCVLIQISIPTVNAEYLTVSNSEVIEQFLEEI